MSALERLGPSHLVAFVAAYRDALRAHQERLNRLNVYPVPDGDTGTNMALTLESVVAELKGVDENDMAAVCKAVRHGSLMGARGNSGVILSQVLAGVTDRLKAGDTVGGADVAAALAQASKAAYEAVLHPTEGTILTVARETSDAAVAAVRGEASLAEVLEAARARAEESLENTPKLLPVLAEAGVVDAGGAGFVLLLDAMLQVVDGRPVPPPPEILAGKPAPATEEAGGRQGDGGRYEVMFLLEGADDDRIPAFKQRWDAIGDSIVVVGGDGLWNCHIHADNVGAAIEAALDVGRPRRIQVADLAQQVEEERWIREGLAEVPAEVLAEVLAEVPEASASPSAPAATAVVVVAAGDGITGIFRSLGAAEVVAGGQSMNPSTAELVAAADGTAGETVVILPNNKNVVPVAERAAGLASRPVRVVPTTSVAEGFAAMMGFDAEADADTNAKAMVESAAQVSWGEVTWAVRDATTPIGRCREGDHLAFLGHDIVAIDADVAAAACALLDRLVDGDHEIVTVVEGATATPEATVIIRKWLDGNRPGVAVEVHRGGQPLAAYIFSAE